MKNWKHPSTRNWLFRRSALAAVTGILAGGSVVAADTTVSWYSAGSGGGQGGTGTWSQPNTTLSWYDGSTYMRWNAATAAYGTSSTNLVVANFAGTAGTVTVGNLGNISSTFIGSVIVATGGYQFVGSGTISLAGSDRVHLLVDTADNTPVTFGSNVAFALRNSIRTFQIGDGDDVTIGGVIDNGRINKTGNGVLRLTGANTISQHTAITVTAGTLLVNNTTGSGTGDSGLTVASGATLGGTGTIGTTGTTESRSIRVAGTLSPGDNSASTLFFDFANPTSRLVLDSGSSLAFTLGTTSDLVSFTQAGDWLSGTGLGTLNITQGTGFSYDESYVIFQNVTTADFTLAGVTGYDNSIYQANFQLVGTDYVLSFSPVPEPSVAALVTVGGLLGLLQRRRKSAAVA
jgi:hypothetical protein